MKKYLLAISMATVLFIGCKDSQKENNANNEEENTAQTNVPILSGEFIYVDNAAVLKGNDFIYGIVIDSLAKELSKEVEPLKREKYDMVPVTIQGEIQDNPNKDGWEKVVKIEKIIKVNKPTSSPGIKVIGKEETLKKGELKAKK